MCGLATCLIATLMFIGAAVAQTTDAKSSPWRAPRAAYPWFDVAFDDARTTGTCIGKLVSPRCAIETAYACILRGGELCKLVFIDHRSINLYIEQKRFGQRIRYRVAAMTREQPFFLANTTTSPDAIAWHVNDVVVHVEEHWCVLVDQLCPPPPPAAKWFVVRNVDGIWKIVIGHTPAY